MASKVKLIASSIIIIIVSIAIYNFVSFGIGNILSEVFLLLITPLVWLLYKRYESLSGDYAKLNTEIETIENVKKILTKENQEYELLLESLEGVIFTQDIKSNNVYFFKGAELILGHSDKVSIKNESLWKQIIHPDDVIKFEKSQNLLQSGQKTRTEYRIILPHQHEKWVLNISTPIISEDGTIEKINGQIIEITDRKGLENQLKQMAYFDDLTDLPNRKSLDRHIEKALARSKRHNHNFTLMFVDLDDFKIVNDTMGHDAGDILLQQVVSRINDTIREEDLLARIGGDEFIVVFEETNKDEVEDIAQRILDTVSLPYDINEKEAKISLSIGISMYPDDGEDKGTLIEHADKAMYFAKNNGKNSYKLYTSDLADIEFKKTGIWEKWMTAIQNSKLFNG